MCYIVSLSSFLISEQNCRQRQSGYSNQANVEKARNANAWHQHVKDFVKSDGECKGHSRSL